MTMTIFLPILSFILLPGKSRQQDYDCTYINGQGCMNGICKFCAMCVPSSCILATPYSTGNNEGSTCAATHQKGYEFYNYCISSGSDYDGDQCDTSTQCYQYRQGNNTSAMHSWDNLTCDLDTCSLINFDGSLPATPIPLDNNTLTTPTSNSTDNYHPPNNNSNRHHSSPFDLRSGSGASIALTTVCIFVSLCLLAWLVRIIFYKTKYWPVINKFLCCGCCAYKPSDETSANNSTSIPSSAPPSFHSARMVMRSNSNSSQNSVLPNYFQQDASPPKYEQAIVTQIRGMRFLDHHPLNNGDNSEQQQQPIWVSTQQPVWMPVYLSSSQQSTSNNNGIASFPTFISGNNSQDWATQTIRHQPSSTEEEEIDVTEIQRR